MSRVPREKAGLERRHQGVRLETGWAETQRAGSRGGGCWEGRVLWAGWGLVLLLAWKPVPVRCGGMPSALRSGFWGDLGSPPGL